MDKMYEEDSAVDTYEDDNEWVNPFDEKPATSKSTNHYVQHTAKHFKTSLAESDIPTSKLNHARTIVHIDIDCFYAQVEMIRNPQLREQPIGIQQKYIIVTCNYKAREYGVTKLMSIKDAKDKCPQLILVNGEDLTHYREMSYKISEFLQKYTPCVERLGFDENYLDVSEMVQQRINSGNHGDGVKGHLYTEDSEEGKQTVPCDCGCSQRLMIGSEIANDIRCSLYDELGITGCAGISYNKLLSKQVGEQHKPNQQTTLMANQTQVFMSSMKKARKIPGIGSTTANKLSRLGVVSVTDLQKIPVSDLVPELGETQAFTIKQLSWGVDDSAVVPYGRPQTLSDEDSFKKCSTVSEVKSKAVQLITSLFKRVKEDGRIVQTIRLTIRKLNAENKWTKRESRQCPVPHHIALKITQGKTDVVLQELETLVMGLFTKLIDVSSPFHLTLMNIAFCNLTEKPKNSIQNFLSPKKSDNLSNENVLIPKNVCDTSEMKTKDKKKDKPGIMSFFKSQQQKDGHEINNKIKTETERKRKQDEDFSQNESKKKKSEEVDTSLSQTNELCMGNVDKEVFHQLPSDIQEEIVKTNSDSLLTKSLLKTCEVSENSESRLESDRTSKNISNNNCENDDLKRKLTAAGINVDDFYTFPPEIQRDILEQYNISLKQNTCKQNKKSILNYFTAKRK